MRLKQSSASRNSNRLWPRSARPYCLHPASSTPDHGHARPRGPALHHPLDRLLALFDLLRRAGTVLTLIGPFKGWHHPGLGCETLPSEVRAITINHCAFSSNGLAVSQHLSTGRKRNSAIATAPRVLLIAPLHDPSFHFVTIQAIVHDRDNRTYLCWTVEIHGTPRQHIYIAILKYNCNSPGPEPCSCASSVLASLLWSSTASLHVCTPGSTALRTDYFGKIDGSLHSTKAGIS